MSTTLPYRLRLVGLGAALALGLGALAACENPAAGNVTVYSDPLTAPYDTSLHIDITQYQVTTNGAFFKDSVVGSGNTVATGKTVSVRYVGRLIDGTIFDQNTATGSSALTFTIGAGSVIKGFDEGLIGMRAGGKRVIIIPPKLGYGSNAQAGIPANSILIFLISSLTSN
jgi:hypothetical protein